MCIYFGNLPGLTYKSEEHVLPAALGCCTKLKNQAVSDQANKFFSPIERDVLEHSLIQISRIIDGPGKRGKLNKKYATTSEVSLIKQNGRNGLGYMKGTKGHILSQFIIDENNKIQFHYQPDEEVDEKNEIEKLQECICSMEDKYVLVKMPQDDPCIYLAYFKDKMYVGFHAQLSDDKIKEIKNLFDGNITKGKQNTFCDQLSITIEITHNLKNLSIVAAKSAINTLAYLKGTEYITQTTNFNAVIKTIMSGSEEILRYVKVIHFDEVQLLRRKLYLDKEQLACILTMEGKRLKAWFLVYEHGFEVSLCDNCTISCDILLDGIVCDWRNRKDYRYLDFLKEKFILC